MTRVDHIRQLLGEVYDPEIPVVSIVDLGIVRDIRDDGQSMSIDLTPTYSGCPALDVIPILVEQKLEAHGYKSYAINTVLSPAWTTEWISDKGRANLQAFGIAPPVPRNQHDPLDLESLAIPCPQCNSGNTRLVSRFGSTACKAAFQCSDCLEPFDYFKCF